MLTIYSLPQLNLAIHHTQKRKVQTILQTMQFWNTLYFVFDYFIKLLKNKVKNSFLVVLMQSNQQSVQQQADCETVWLFRSLSGLFTDVLASPQLPLTEGRSPKWRAHFPPPHDNLPRGGSPSVHPVGLGTHAQGLRSERPSGIHSSHQPDYSQI